LEIDSDMFVNSLISAYIIMTSLNFSSPKKQKSQVIHSKRHLLWVNVTLLWHRKVAYYFRQPNDKAIEGVIINNLDLICKERD